MEKIQRGIDSKGITMVCKAKKCVHHLPRNKCELLDPVNGDKMISNNKDGQCEDFHTNP